MASRVTKSSLEVLSLSDPRPRVTKAYLEVLSGAAPKSRVTQASIEVLYTEVTAAPAALQPIAIVCT